MSIARRYFLQPGPTEIRAVDVVTRGQRIVPVAVIMKAIAHHQMRRTEECDGGPASKDWYQPDKKHSMFHHGDTVG